MQKYKDMGPALMPEGLDEQLLVRQIQILADGACDAMALAFFETGRGEMKSDEWFGRQLRKVNGVLKACDEIVVRSEGRFVVGDEFSVADIALGAMLGMMDMVETQFGLIRWKDQYPELMKYWEMLEARESFMETRPVMFELTEKVA